MRYEIDTHYSGSVASGTGKYSSKKAAFDMFDTLIEESNVVEIELYGVDFVGHKFLLKKYRTKYQVTCNALDAI